MEWATNAIAEIYEYLNCRDDTSIDRLNRLYTVALLSAFVTLITTQQYVVGGRIICWTPKDFSDAHITYANDICWLGHTNYYVSQNSTTLDSPFSPRSYPFSMYPWLPIVLIGMTVSFAAPYLLIWHGLSTRSGINIKRLLELENHEKLTQAIHYIFSKNYSIKNNGRFYVISIYLLMRVFYIINLFGQIILINKLLTGNYLKMNIEHILKILSVKYNMWSSVSYLSWLLILDFFSCIKKAHLPIETMCDFMVRMLGDNNNWYTIQCVLPFNLFTKRIFALLSIWFSILLILNLIDLIVTWLWQRIWLRSRRYDYVFRLFRLYELYVHKPRNNQKLILETNHRPLRHEFVYRYLGIDGYLLLKFLHANSTDIHMSYLVAELFKTFLRMIPPRPKKTTTNDNNIVL